MATITTRVIRNARKRGVVVYDRRGWKCVNLAIYQWRRIWRKHAKNPSDTLWSHITVTHNTENIKADMRVLHSIGMDRFGSGVSYNFAIDPITGEVGLGQSLDAKGTHTVFWRKDVRNFSYDQNLVAHAIAWIGMPGMVPTRRAKKSYAKLVAAMIEEGALTKGHDHLPHSFAVAGTPYAKDCPTEAGRQALPDIDRRVKVELEKG